jgi:ACR3 family arsenite transporter
MKDIENQNDSRKMTSVFERYLPIWVILCIIAGIILGKFAPGLAGYLDGMAIYVNDAPVSY